MEAKLEKLRQELAEGLLYIHARLSENTTTTLEAASFLYAFIELFSEKGLLSIEELERAQAREVAKRLVKKNSAKGVGVLLQEPEYDKYTFPRVRQRSTAKIVSTSVKHPVAVSPSLCPSRTFAKASCSRNMGQPYMIAQEKDGYCTHLERGSCQCVGGARTPDQCPAVPTIAEKTTKSGWTLRTKSSN